jgi:hypothetical protein
MSSASYVAKIPLVTVHFDSNGVPATPAPRPHNTVERTGVCVACERYFSGSGRFNFQNNTMAKVKHIIKIIEAFSVVNFQGNTMAQQFKAVFPTHTFKMVCMGYCTGFFFYLIF